MLTTDQTTCPPRCARQARLCSFPTHQRAALVAVLPACPGAVCALQLPAHSRFIMPPPACRVCAAGCIRAAPQPRLLPGQPAQHGGQGHSHGIQGARAGHRQRQLLRSGHAAAGQCVRGGGARPAAAGERTGGAPAGGGCGCGRRWLPLSCWQPCLQGLSATVSSTVLTMLKESSLSESSLRELFQSSLASADARKRGRRKGPAAIPSFDL